jgi:signal transduction histidine kinase/DNA-binding response OmpR family regulator/ligand-binding sensor domain-containing protein
VRHRVFTRADGLPHATIQALAQAPDGRLWIGTNAGLAVYDGHEIRPAPLPDSLENAFVCTIQARAPGTVWVVLKGRGIVGFRKGRLERVEPHLWEGEGACASGLLARGDTAVVATEQSFRVLPPEADTVLHTPYTFASAADRAKARQVWAGREDSLRIASVTRGPDGTLWALDHRRGLARLAPDGTVAFVDGLRPASFPEFWLSLALTSDGHIHMSTTNGLYRVGPALETIRKVSSRVHRRLFARGASLYAAHQNTAVHWNLRTGRTHRYGPALGLPDTQYYRVREDDRGGLWIGTQRGLLFLPAPRVRTIATIDGTDLRWTTDLARNPARESVWLSTWGFGLFRLAPSPTNVNPARRLTPSQDGRNNWVLTSRDHPGGVDTVGRSGWIRKGKQGWRILHPKVAAVGGHVDSTGAGVFLSDHGILRVRSDPSAPIDTLAQWPRDAFPYHHFRLLGDGTLLYRAREHFIRLSLDDPTVADTVATVPSLTNVRAGTMVVLDDHVWLGTGTKGLLRLHRDRETVTSFLPDQRVRRLATAGDSLLLAGTNDGLYLVDTPTGHVRRRLTTADGLLSNTASGRVYDDTLYVAHLYGVSILSFQKALASPGPPRPKITGLSVNGSSHPVADSLRLGVDERTLEFRFSGVHLSKGTDVRHAYRLVPYDTTWHTTTARQTRYTDLPPGSYTFQVRAELEGGPAGGPATVHVTLPPAVYETTWFWWVCGLAGLGLVAGAYRLRVRVLQRRQEELQRLVTERTRRLAEEKEKTEAQAERLAALDDEKNRFFANISHELRTPLTVLVGTLDDALHGTFGDVPLLLRQQLEILETHVQRIRHLADQLLDLARLETTDPALDAAPRDLVTFVRCRVEAFAPLADRRGLHLDAEIDPDAHPCLFDRDKLEAVLDNLLSNALTFTPSGGSVTVRLDVEENPEDETPLTAVLQVADTGRGIPEEEQEHIFERFTFSRSREEDTSGTGIGLTLVREFAEMHGGSVALDSTPGVGSTFTVRLPLPPVEADAVETDDLRPSGASDPLAVPAVASGDGEAGTTRPPDPESEADAPVLLVADDNADVRAYLRRHLQGDWTVVEAADGAEARDTARRVEPDLVLADVMMPEMDGLALTRELRDDDALDRMPILLLTARAADDEAVAGLDAGADDYVTKPFSIDELKARLRQHLQACRAWTGTEDDALLTPEVDLTPDDEAFLDRVTDAIDDHLSRASLTVDDLAAEVGLSPRQLQRTLKRLTGCTAAAFIRRYRLEHAAERLAEGAGTVSQIADRVGFGTTATFAKHFKTHFDCTPSAYAEQHRADGSSRAS